MAVFKRYWLPGLILLILSFLYAALRLYHLTTLPIFTDEAIYIRWGQIAKNDANWRFISLTDGKQPMFVWVMILIMKYVKDPLLAGRLVSVGSGLLSLIGMFFLGWEMFKNKWVGIASSVLYLLSPFAVVYDRMALYDTMVGTFAVWSLYFLILLVRRIRLDLAMIFGLVAGGGVLTKTSGFFSIYLLPLIVFLFDWREKKRVERVIKLIGLLILSTIFTYLCYAILHLSPFFHIIDEKNALFVYPFKEWLHHPLLFFNGNLIGVWNWYIMYTTLPIFLLTVGAFFVKGADRKMQIILAAILAFSVVILPFQLIHETSLREMLTAWWGLAVVTVFLISAFVLIRKEYIREKIFLVLWFLGPFTALALFGKVLYPRFIFFMALALLPLAAYTIVSLWKRVPNIIVYAAVCILLFALPIRSIFMILHDFATSPIPYSDVSQYNNDWTSGGGVKEAVAFFKEQAQTQKIFIATEGTFGLMPFSLEIYLKDNPNVEIYSFWPVEEMPPATVLSQAKKMPTYVVFYQPCPSCRAAGIAPASWPVKLIYQQEKFYSNRFFSIYQVLPRRP